VFTHDFFNINAASARKVYSGRQMKSLTKSFHLKRGTNFCL